MSRRAPVVGVAALAVIAGGVLTFWLMRGTVHGSPLERAALAAAAARGTPSPAVGRYLYAKTREGQVAAGGTSSAGVIKAWAFTTSDTTQTWIAPDGSGRVVITPAARPDFLSPLDEATWAASGQALPGGEKTSDRPYGTGTLTDPDKAHLPTDPEALRRALTSRLEKSGASDAATFDLAAAFLQESRSPALRAALYRVLERLPGIDDLGRMTDLAGRAGAAVGYTSKGRQYQLIFDPSTSAVLEERQVVVAPAAVAMPPIMPQGLPAGTVIEYTLYLAAGHAGSSSTVPADQSGA